MHSSPLQEISAVTEVLKQDERIVAAYVLGSALGDFLRPDSDIDIAVLPGPGCVLTQVDRLRLFGQLGDHCHRQVDVGILSTSNLVYAREAVLGGQCLFCTNVPYRDLFVATALGLYAEMRIARKVVEDAYTA